MRKICLTCILLFNAFTLTLSAATSLPNFYEKKDSVSVIEKSNTWLQIINHHNVKKSHSNYINEVASLCNYDITNKGNWQSLNSETLENLSPGDIFLFVSHGNRIESLGLYVDETEFLHITEDNGVRDLRLYPLKDIQQVVSNSQVFVCPVNCSTEQGEEIDPIEEDSNNVEERPIVEDEPSISDEVLPCSIAEHFSSYFINEERLPLVVTPKYPPVTLAEVQEWMHECQDEFNYLLDTYGAILLRDCPIQDAYDFAKTTTLLLGTAPLDYRGGEGSRKKIIDGVYTSSEAPSKFHIPLHNELSCTMNPPSYINFYCDIAPKPGTGQTILGKTLAITDRVKSHPEIWNLFEGRNIKYISRHPPKDSFYTKVNKTHKSWQEMFATDSKDEVEAICAEKGFTCRWKGGWLEVIRIAPAVHTADSAFASPYWFNQMHLYHINSRLHGGWFNYLLSHLLYIDSNTRPYDVRFAEGGEIPKKYVCKIYDILNEQTIKFSWEKGDALIVDNKRTWHGRNPYSGARRVLVSLHP